MKSDSGIFACVVFECGSYSLAAVSYRRHSVVAVHRRQLALGLCSLVVSLEAYFALSSPPDTS